LKDFHPGEAAIFQYNGEIHSVLIVDSIPIYHKIAIADVDAGHLVYKYGQVIGKAVQPIKTGQHVHTHNLVSIREEIGGASV